MNEMNDFHHGDRVRIIKRLPPWNTGTVVEDWKATGERRREHLAAGLTVVVREDDRLRAYRPEDLEHI